MNQSNLNTVRDERGRLLHEKNTKRIIQEIHEGRELMTPLALATRWGLTLSHAANLIQNNTRH